MQIVEWRDAQGAVAVYSLPHDPYVAVLPLFFWALLRQDGADEIAGIVSYRGKLIPAGEMPQGELFGYLSASFDEATRTYIRQRAALYGQGQEERLREASPPAPMPHPPVAEEPRPSRRKRRRRGTASPALAAPDVIAAPDTGAS